jgi:hypothetical protein
MAREPFFYTMNRSEIIIRGNKFYKRTIAESPIPINQISLFDSFGLNDYKYIPNVIDNIGFTLDQDSQVKFTSSTLNPITLDTEFCQAIGDAGESIIYPAYRQDDGSIRLKLNYEFSFNEDVQFNPILITKWHISQINNIFFVLLINGEAYKMPLPNIHSDGKFCMGSFWDEDRGYDNKAEGHKQVEEYINQSEWNTDLLPNISTMIRFKEVMGSWNPLPINLELFKKDTYIISNEELQWLSQV